MLMRSAMDAVGFLSTLVVATAANDGSLSLQRYAAGLDFLSPHIEHGKEEAAAAEKSSVKGFEELMAAKKKEVGALTKAIEEKTQQVGTLSVATVELKNDLEDMEQALAEDNKVLSTLAKEQKQAVDKVEAELKKLEEAANGKPLSERNGTDLLKEQALSPQLSNAPSRGLQGVNLCVKWLVEWNEAAAFEKLRTCITEKEKTTDMRVAGARFAVNHGCWCETGMSDVLDEYGCASSPSFGVYFQASCTPTCSSTAAQQCLQDCPASCLELDYAPEFCSTAFENCVEHLACITEHSKNMTLAGHLDHPFQCDDQKFYDSPEWVAWKECDRQLPKRTVWHRHNAQNHCFCESNLKAAAQKHICCDSSWGKGICDEQCATATTSIDCLTAEAVQCMGTCNDVCRSLLVSHTSLSAECQQQCFNSNSTCAKYSVCPPAGDVQFDYVCDNGQPPAANGCCGSTSRTACPSQCSHATHFMWSVFENGHECQCLGCPSSLVAAKAKMAAQLENDMDSHGIQALASISKQVGILGANRKMQELMNTRNAEIQQAFKDHPGNIDDAWNEKAAKIVADYRALIVAEAEAFKARGEVDDVPSDGPGRGGGSTNKGGKKGNNNKTPIIIGAVCGAVGLGLCAASLLLYRRGKAASARGNGGNIAPNDGDTNVVMGRPVQTGDAMNAAQGAPVNREAEKGTDEAEKPTVTVAR